MRNGFMAYTTETRGALKKLLPTCTQPTAQELAAADAFQKKQQEIYDANVAKANPQADSSRKPRSARAGPAATNQRRPRTPRSAPCAAASPPAGFLPPAPATRCWAPSARCSPRFFPAPTKRTRPGPTMAGVFQGAGNWRLDFIDGGVLVNCAFLSPNQESYTLDFKNGHAMLTIDTTPRPLVLTVRADGTIVGPPGPVTIDGVVAAGYVSGAAGDLAPRRQDSSGNLYDVRRQSRPRQCQLPGYTKFAPRRATCPALNLSSKGAGVGIQTMQTDLLKTMFGGDKGPPTPPGIRMHGIFAASTGFSVEFYPESVILGCGPDAARAYPYTVAANGSGAVIKIDAADHPLSLAFGPDGSLDPGGSGPYQVHGRIVTGQNDNDDFTFAPLEQTCNLAVLTPSKTDPFERRLGRAMTASARNSGDGHRRRTLLCSRPIGQRHALHCLRISPATGRSESARRASLRSSARQLRKRTRKGWRLRPARSVAL